MNIKFRNLWIIIAIFAINGLWYSVYIKTREKASIILSGLNNDNSRLGSEINDRELLIRIAYSNELMDQIEYNIAENITLPLRNEDYYFCCYFNQSVCSPCLLKVIQDINTLKTDFNFHDFLIITDTKSPKKNLNDIEWPCSTLYLTKFPLYKNHSFNILLFIFDPLNGVREVYCPELFPDFQQEYFLKIREEIKKMQKK